jgi:malonyl CoA-acyl carrier protein transacylase
VLAGGVEAVDAAIARLSAAGITARRIQVASAFHSPLVQAAGRLMADLLDRTELALPRLPVFSNTLGAAYPTDPAAMRQLLTEHITAPVRFADQIEAMYQAGARIFVEVGPRSVLSNLVREILSDRQPLVLATDSSGRHGVTQLLHVLAQLAVAGLQVDFDELWRGRDAQPLQLAKLAPTPPLAPHVWMVNGGRARRQSEPVVPVPPPTIAQSIVPPVSPRQPVEPEPAGAVAADQAWVPDSPTAIASVPSHEGVLMPSDSSNPLSPFVADPGTADVMRQFQQLMGQFLQTQALVMTAYLQGAPVAGASLASLASAPPRPLPERPAPPVYERAPAMTAVAPPAPVVTRIESAAVAPAPAHQSVSRVAALATKANGNVNPNGSANGDGAHTRESAAPSVLARLLEIVSDRTGYPQEMLAVDAPMEADLGIDSIKRMEILTTFQQTHAGAQRGAFQDAMERLTAIKTLRETATVLEELMAAPAESASAHAQVM